MWTSRDCCEHVIEHINLIKSGCSLLSERLIASQAGFCCMYLVIMKAALRLIRVSSKLNLIA
jgi:hypothetical protein